MTVTALATLDDVVIAVPMALSQPLRDDDVQGLSDGGIASHSRKCAPLQGSKNG